ncbi:Na+/H+ antiporter subunit E [Legionella clemsonensis]|uniref:Na(+)/H(+) antiporter subunit E n=1 Tax=Legionella clemsonensis TaxID=1867846 RepID=A0A222P1R0_9GAMM|nr:Na+/H+ antiporter subunit E [Legionella clemsonensis]ASQ45751.1 Na(+)/H(+) antiporter subunit E [Legionella clemsonensis]
MNYFLKPLFKPIKLTRFIFYVLWEILIANLRVAYHVITPGLSARPGVIAIPLDCKTALEITWFANIISLTPGTLVLDISAEKKEIYVHAMFVDDRDYLKKSIKYRFEQPILELFQ